MHQHPDDNSSLGSAELLNNDHDVTNQLEYDENTNEPAELNNGEPNRSQRGEEMLELFAPTVEMMTRQERQTDPLMDERPMTQSRTRCFQVRVRDIRVMLFSTVDSRRVKFVNWLLLPLISVLYYLVFSHLVLINNGTTQGLAVLSMVLLSYHKVQSIRTLRTMTLSPNFSKLMQFQKRFCLLWLVLYTIAYIIELVIFIDTWFSFFGEHFSYIAQAAGVLSFLIGMYSGSTYAILERMLGRNQTPVLLLALRNGFFVWVPIAALYVTIHLNEVSIETARGVTLLSFLWLPSVHPNGM